MAAGVPDADFAGRAVFIGAGAASLRDIFATPFAPDVPGVEVLATLAANLAGAGPIREGAAMQWETLLAALGAVLAAGLPRAPLDAVVTTLAVRAGAGALLAAAFARGAALDAVTVLGAALAASALHRAARLRRDQGGTRRLARFLSPLTSRTPDSGGGARAEPAWRTEAATVAFVDLEGSVGIAEDQPPDATAALLARIHARVDAVAARHRGTVVERMGDGALLVFGFGRGTAADALAFARAITDADGEGSARLRVSLHHGPVALADIGGGAAGHLTLAGDTVNIAARLQDVAKEAGVAAVMGEPVRAAAGLDPAAAPADFCPLAETALRIRRAPFAVRAFDPAA